MDLRELTPSQELADRLFPPTDIGPIWQSDEDGEWLLPDKTLGWQIAAWAENNLGSVDGEGRLRFTDEQLRILLWFYAVDEEGRYAYRRLALSLFKGWGKDPMAAVMCVIEFVGPSRFSHWDDDGQPVGMANPQAWVHLLAVSKEQNINTMSVLPALMTQEFLTEYKIELHKELAFAPGGRRLQMVGSSNRSLEGRRTTFAVMNETQHWLSSNGGHELYKTEMRNLSKTGGRAIMITNAYRPGEDSIAERVRLHQEKVWAGIARPSGWLYHAREAHPKAPLAPEWVPFIMERIIGDCWWWRNKLHSLVTDIVDSASTDAADTRRMFYSQIVSGEGAFFTKDEIDGALKPGCTGTVRDLQVGDEVVLGFDGSKTNDSTALVAIRISDRLIVPLEVQQKPEGVTDWHVDQQAIDEAVGMAFTSYKVKAFFADVNLWESYITKWGEEYGEHLEVQGPNSKIGFDMRGSKEKVSRHFEAFRQAIRDKTLLHNGDGFWRTHALNAHMGHNGRGLIARKAKPDSPHKIDVMIASYLAYTALTTWLEKGRKKPQYSRRILRSSQRAGY